MRRSDEFIEMCVFLISSSYKSEKVSSRPDLSDLLGKFLAVSHVFTNPLMKTFQDLEGHEKTRSTHLVIKIQQYYKPLTPLETFRKI